MKYWLTFICVCLCSIVVLHAQSPSAYDLVPKPQHLEKLEGQFHFGHTVKIKAPNNFKAEVKLLREALWLNTADQSVESSGKIVFKIKAKKYSDLEAEGYRLIVHSDEILVEAAHRKGAIYGLFTLLQLQQIQADQSRIPAVSIVDKPAFVYRGMHLDVSRHFFPVSFIKKYIDMLAYYKFNTFHWHLTDGQGWRLEIKKYPKLTNQAAWRTNGKKLNWHMGDERFLHEGDPNAYGGYYTQDEAREVVAYAAKRGITVIPEIEMPGHSEEVLAVYPQLSCSGKPYVNTEFCIGNDSTFVFLKDVLTEVMAIFPSKYIHIGGDEASMEPWKTCPKDQALMKEQGFTDVAQLQSYAVKEMGKFLKAHGRKLLGWDEILKGGLAPGATVMSWRGETGGIEAARMGHDVVMTPGTYMYLDHYQSDPNTQPKAISGYTPLRKVYSYHPVPTDSLTLAQQKHILGVQANLWTEYIPSRDHVEYMIFPRMLAVAEIGWTPEKERHFHDFHRRLQSQYRLLQRHAVNYYRPSFRLQVKAVPNYATQQYTVTFFSEQYNPTIYYTTDGSTPTPDDQLYKGAFEVSGNTTVTAAIFREGKPVIAPKAFTVNYHKAIGKSVTYNKGGWSNNYPAQEYATLTNGIVGGLTYQDLQWQGFLHDMDVVVDLEKVTDLHQLSMRFMQLIGPGVYMPNQVEVEVSTDGEHYTEVGVVKNDVSPTDDRLLFKTFTVDLSGHQGRYIRVKVDKQNGFMFTDEIMVN